MRIIKRCEWGNTTPLLIDYHDKEWGKAVKDDDTQFEFLVLETFQAGLSWHLVLNKRENFRKAFDGFNYKKIAQYTNNEYKRLINDTGIIRNKLKIEATITNAQAFMKVQETFGSFSTYIWEFTKGKQIINTWKKMSELPAKTMLSDQVSADMKKRGFKFTGSTVIYAHLQATGIVNDHVVDCFRYKEVMLEGKG